MNFGHVVELAPKMVVARVAAVAVSKKDHDNTETLKEVIFN